MKILVVLNSYWPWNAPGSMRWFELGYYLKFNVFTSRRPRSGFYDDTMVYPGRNRKIFRFSWKLPAILWGLIASFRVLFRRGYDVYIFSSPPESLLLGAWLCQLIGRKVVVDFRDQIDRERQRHKWAVPIYKWLARRIRNKVVVAKFIGPGELIPHGFRYQDLLKLEFNSIYYQGRLAYKDYYKLLRLGVVPSSRNKPRKYISSSWPQVKQLGLELDAMNTLHPEVREMTPIHWREVAHMYWDYLEKTI